MVENVELLNKCIIINRSPSLSTAFTFQFGFQWHFDSFSQQSACCRSPACLLILRAFFFFFLSLLMTLLFQGLQVLYVHGLAFLASWCSFLGYVSWCVFEVKCLKFFIPVWLLKSWYPILLLGFNLFAAKGSFPCLLGSVSSLSGSSGILCLLPSDNECPTVTWRC